MQSVISGQLLFMTGDRPNCLLCPNLPIVGVISGQFAAQRLILAKSEDVPSLHQLMNLGGALIDCRAFAVSEVTFDAALIRITVCSVNLYGIIGGSVRGICAIPFCHARFAGIAQTTVFQVRHFAYQQFSQVDALLH